MATLLRVASFPPSNGCQFLFPCEDGSAFIVPEALGEAASWSSFPHDGSLPVAGAAASSMLPDTPKQFRFRCTSQVTAAGARQSPFGSVECQLRAMEAAGQSPEPEADDYGAWVQNTLPLHSGDMDRCNDRAGCSPVGVVEATPAEAEATATTSQVPALPARPSSTTLCHAGEVEASSPQPAEQATNPPTSPQRPTVRIVVPALSSVCGGGAMSLAAAETEETVDVEDGADGEAATNDDTGPGAAPQIADDAHTCHGPPRRQSSGCLPATLSEYASMASTCVAADDQMSEVDEPAGAAVSGAAAAHHHQEGFSLQEGCAEVGVATEPRLLSVPLPPGAGAVGRPRRARAGAVASKSRAQEAGVDSLKAKRQKRAAAQVATVVAVAAARDDATTDDDYAIEEQDYEELEGDDEEYTVRGKAAGAGAKRLKMGPKQGRPPGRLVSGAICLECGAVSTPQWRCGPKGPRTLCNACGVRYKKIQTKCGHR